MRVHTIPRAIPDVIRTGFTGDYHRHGAADWAVRDTPAWDRGDGRLGAGEVSAVPQGRIARRSCSLFSFLVRIFVGMLTIMSIVVPDGVLWR